MKRGFDIFDTAIATAIAALAIAGTVAAWQGPAKAQYTPPAFYGATGVQASAIGTTTAYTVTLPAVVGKTAFLCGYTVTGVASTPSFVPSTITGLISGTMNFMAVFGVSANIPVSQPPQTFSPCLPASAQNVAVVLNVGAAGTAGSSVTLAYGYYQ